MTKHILIIANYTDNQDIILAESKDKLDEKSYTYEIINTSSIDESVFALKIAIDLDIYDGFIMIIKKDNKDDLYIEKYKLISKISLDYLVPIGYSKLDDTISSTQILNSTKSLINMIELSEFFMSKLEFYDKDLIGE